MVPAAEPLMSVSSTVTCNAGAVWRTCPDQEPASDAGNIVVAVGEADAVRGDVPRGADAAPSGAARGADAARSGSPLRTGWCIKIKVEAMAIAPTHATQAVSQPARRTVDRAGGSSGALPGTLRGTPRAAARDRLAPSASRPAAGSPRPSRAVATLRALGRLPGSGARQAATVARSGSGRAFRACRPVAR